MSKVRIVADYGGNQIDFYDGCSGDSAADAVEVLDRLASLISAMLRSVRPSEGGDKS